MGFRSLTKFNIALLVKQGWRILHYPKSSLARVLKAKYFPNGDFLNFDLGNLPSYSWKSISVAKGPLRDGLCWRIRFGTNIFVVHDAWLPGSINYKMEAHVELQDNVRVSDFINIDCMSWNEDLISHTFPEEIVVRILRIPLPREPMEDVLVWNGESIGEFSVRSAYKLLHKSSFHRNYTNFVSTTFYMKRWQIQIPHKVKLHMWRATWNFLPTFVNLCSKRVRTDSLCLRCKRAPKTLHHVFRECEPSKMVWHNFILEFVVSQISISNEEWFTWVFEYYSPLQLRLFVCGIWAIWSHQNKKVHEGLISSGKQIADWVIIYLSKIEAVQDEKLIVV